jgi:hypothetical protein
MRCCQGGSCTTLKILKRHWTLRHETSQSVKGAWNQRSTQIGVTKAGVDPANEPAAHKRAGSAGNRSSNLHGERRSQHSDLEKRPFTRHSMRRSPRGASVIHARPRPAVPPWREPFAVLGEGASEKHLRGVVLLERGAGEGHLWGSPFRGLLSESLCGSFLRGAQARPPGTSSGPGAGVLAEG